MNMRLSIFFNEPPPGIVDSFDIPDSFCDSESGGLRDRDDTKISIMGFYDMEDYNKKIEALKARYGEELAAEAQGLAGIVYSTYDYDIVRDILEKMEIYGTGPVRKAFGYVKKMRVDNYKRTYNYVVNIIKRHAD